MKEHGTACIIPVQPNPLQRHANAMLIIGAVIAIVKLT